MIPAKISRMFNRLHWIWLNEDLVCYKLSPREDIDDSFINDAILTNEIKCISCENKPINSYTIFCKECHYKKY